jgi:hypothetical protein
MERRIVGANIDTWLINVCVPPQGYVFPADLEQRLDLLKEAAQQAEDDLATEWTFAGETLFIKPHGSQRQWRWILQCPSLHLDIGRGKHNHVVGKARLASALLWEHGPGNALSLLYTFLAHVFGEGFTLQVSEVHLCADLAGWELAVEDTHAFITRGHHKAGHIPDANAAMADDTEGVPSLAFHLSGRRCTGFEFSRGGAHSCRIYDKTKELVVSHKDWMRAIWERNGWDGTSQVVRVEFVYKRECLRELGIEEPYAMLDQFSGMWAYSTQQWLRHTVPTGDTNRGRWESSPFWQAIQRAAFFGEAEPAVRERKRKGDLTLICQMLAGCATTAAAYLAGELPDTDNGADFLTWFYDWMDVYLRRKGCSFQDLRAAKRLRLGVMALPALEAG